MQPVLASCADRVPSPFVNSSFKVMPISLSPSHRGGSAPQVNLSHSFGLASQITRPPCAEHLAGDVAGVFSGEVQQKLCHLFGGAETAHRGLFGQCRFVLSSERSHHIGVDDAGGHTVHGDAAGTFFFCQRLGQADEARLGGGIVYLTAAAGLAPHTAHGEDTARFAAYHPRAGPAGRG